MGLDMTFHAIREKQTPRRRPPQHAPEGRLGRRDRALADLPAWKERAAELPDIRWDKVAAVRAALANGVYDCEDRLNRLMDCMPDELLALHPEWQ